MPSTRFLQARSDLTEGDVTHHCSARVEPRRLTEILKQIANVRSPWGVVRIHEYLVITCAANVAVRKLDL